jgi:1-acyl-sn-glycerol-3-phosphate acyltransferase
VPRSGLFTRHAGDWADGVEVDHPGRPSPWLVRLSERVLLPLARLLFRATLEGTGHLPEGRPFLLVANHSAGLGIAEIGSFLALYLHQIGPERPLAGFALPLGFHVQPVSSLLRAAGAIPSSYQAAAATLDEGVPILVFPGGDHETLRPIWQAYRVDFGGRTGFLKIAREHGVPIVPMGIRGAHFTAPVLFRSRALANLLVLPRLLGQKRWAVSLLGALGAVAILMLAPVGWPLRIVLVWLWLGSPFVFLPWVPWKIRMRIGEPIKVDAADLEASLRHVEASVQALVRG